MKVQTLIETLKQYDPDSEVRIKISANSIGFTPTVGISKRVINGIDWVRGRVIITPDVELIKKDR